MCGNAERRDRTAIELAHLCRRVEPSPHGGKFILVRVNAPNYIELSASTYDAALTLANTQAGTNTYVVVQVGSDTVVFVDQDGDHDIDDAVTLVGRTLADISAANIV